jgi:hypothetical protein
MAGERRTHLRSIDDRRLAYRLGCMSPTEVAHRLVELCRQGAYDQAHKELYADDAVSIEPDFATDNFARGREALAQKGKMFADTFEMHGGTTSEPVVAGNFFSCAMTADVTERKSGARFTIEEVAVFEVKDGKIVREQFFYSPGP